MAVSMFVAHGGEVSRLDVADMREQVAERTARLVAATAPRRSCRLRASSRWSTAPASTAMYRELGAHVIDGGATMNPSTYDLLAAIHAAGARRGDRAAQLART